MDKRRQVITYDGIRIVASKVCAYMKVTDNTPGYGREHIAVIVKGCGVPVLLRPRTGDTCQTILELLDKEVKNTHGP